MLGDDDNRDQRIVELLHSKFAPEGASIDDTMTACVDLTRVPFVPSVAPDYGGAERRLVMAAVLSDPLGLADDVGKWLAQFWASGSQ